MWKEWLHPVAGAAAILAAVIAFVALVAFHYRPVPPGALPLPRDPGAARALAAASAAARTPPAPALRAVRVAPAAGAPTIFRCMKDGVPSYAEVPCGPDAQAQRLDPAALNTYHAAPLGRGSSLVSPDGPSADFTTAPDPGSDAQCREIDAALRGIEERMRHPYSVQEGNRLRTELHRWNGRSFELRCGG